MNNIAKLISPTQLASQQSFCPMSETDPTNQDNDKDLVLDGFKYSNAMSPKPTDC